MFNVDETWLDLVVLCVVLELDPVDEVLEGVAGVDVAHVAGAEEEGLVFGDFALAAVFGDLVVIVLVVFFVAGLEELEGEVVL